MELPDGLKPPQWDARSMSKYNRSELKDVFWTWLCSVIFAYWSSQLGGPDRDEESVLILDVLLGDKAKEWFQDHMSQPTILQPTFVEMIIKMYRRFVVESAQQDTRDTFKSVSWTDSDDHVQGWYDLIKRRVEDMEIPLDKYSIREKFMGGLPFAF